MKATSVIARPIYNNLRVWIGVTGICQPDSSYEYELRSFIDDAINATKQVYQDAFKAAERERQRKMNRPPPVGDALVEDEWMSRVESLVVNIKDLDNG